jgi:glycine cleavage system aminomethyltransferase T
MADVVHAVPSARRLADVLAVTIVDLPASLVDVSDGYCGLVLSGSLVRDVLMRLVPVDVADSAFPAGAVAATHIERVGVVLIRERSGAGYELFLPRSFAARRHCSGRAAGRGVPAVRGLTAVRCVTAGAGRARPGGRRSLRRFAGLATCPLSRDGAGLGCAGGRSLYSARLPAADG